jgi:uncharacterized cupin superfamily protein
MPDEAPLDQWPTGLVPESPGWFVVNVRDVAWAEHPQQGYATLFENPRGEGMPELGIWVRVLQPGQMLSYYHEENAQEAFLMLAGECALIVNGVERRLRAWDFFHCPAGTEHAIVATGDAPAALLALGARHDTERLRYPVSELAARYGASVARETTDPDEAYADQGEWDLGRPGGRFPWS